MYMENPKKKILVKNANNCNWFSEQGCLHETYPKKRDCAKCPFKPKKPRVIHYTRETNAKDASGLE